jgi:hypothetical protein
VGVDGRGVPVYGAIESPANLPGVITVAGLMLEARPLLRQGHVKIARQPPVQFMLEAMLAAGSGGMNGAGAAGIAENGPNPKVLKALFGDDVRQGAGRKVGPLSPAFLVFRRFGIAMFIGTSAEPQNRTDCSVFVSSHI